LGDNLRGVCVRNITNNIIYIFQTIIYKKIQNMSITSHVKNLPPKTVEFLSFTLLLI
jgi:hypothetical protein